MELDLFATGTLPDDDAERQRRARSRPRPAALPRPTAAIPPRPRRQRPRHDRGRCRPVGRAAGSMLPDSSRVAGDRAARRQMGARHLDGPRHRADALTSARAWPAPRKARARLAPSLLQVCPGNCRCNRQSVRSRRQAGAMAVGAPVGDCRQHRQRQHAGLPRAGRRAVRKGARRQPAWRIKATQVSAICRRRRRPRRSRSSERDGRPAVLPSDNTVVLENELMKAGEVRRAFELNTGDRQGLPPHD